MTKDKQHERDGAFEDAAQVVEQSTSWGLSPGQMEAVRSFQAHAAKAIRAQKSDSPERIARTLLGDSHDR